MVASGGFGRVLATQDWHCQGFPAFAVSAPPRIGSARDCWLAGAFFWHCQGLLARAGFRHPVLALPGIPGQERPRAPTPVTELSFDPNASS